MSHVLLCEDDPALAATIARLIEAGGHTCLHASTPNRARRAVAAALLGQADAFHAAVIDLDCGGAEIVTSLPTAVQTIILASRDPEAVRRLARATLNIYFDKPLTPKDEARLLKVLERAGEGH